jgi:hypothetical protein
MRNKEERPNKNPSCDSNLRQTSVNLMVGKISIPQA